MSTIRTSPPKVIWRATLWYNLERAAGAGLVLGVFGALGAVRDALEGTPANKAGVPLATAVICPLVWPVLYLVFFLPVGWLLTSVLLMRRPPQPTLRTSIPETLWWWALPMSDEKRAMLNSVRALVALWRLVKALVGLFGLFIVLIAVALGDPIVCIVKKCFPRVVPVEAPPLFSFQIMIWVLDAAAIAP